MESKDLKETLRIEETCCLGCGKRPGPQLPPNKALRDHQLQEKEEVGFLYKAEDEKEPVY